MPHPRIPSLALAVLLAGALAVASAQTPAPKPAQSAAGPSSPSAENQAAGKQAAANQPGDANAGKTLFQGHCSACHGIDGRGGEAPNIATNPTVQAFSDAQIIKIVTGGLPGGMPAFGAQLGASQIRDIVAYLRVLQGHSSAAGSAVPQGSAPAGEALFFGKAGCSSCHMVNGKGGFLGPNLSGVPLNAAGIREAIVHPRSGPQASWVTAHLKNGATVTGVARNEDNFSIQLQDRSGAFHLLNKSDVASLSRSDQPIMPSDYGSRLSPTELNDIVAFVARQAGPPRRRFRGGD